MMKPLDPHFPSVSVELPTAEMSKAELEFNWKLLGLTTILLRKMRASDEEEEEVDRLRRRYWQEMRKRLHDAMFGPSPATEYSQGETVDWTSANIAVMSDILRGDKALYFLKHTNYSPFSSFTECAVLLNGGPGSTSASGLYRNYNASDDPEHMFYRMLYKKMKAQRDEFIVIACSRFLEQRRNSDSPPNSYLVRELKESIRAKKSLSNRDHVMIS
ncbi:hypothetical protein SeLEV6574_g08661, partial [Synchytrium endobioticum]